MPALVMVLEVKIKAPPGGNSRTMRFSESPIRIGRNQLNDISLEDPFVSEWHGTIRFDSRSISYFDLGSTNGTVLDGKRLPKNVATELTDASRLQLGLLELVASRQEVTPEAEAPKHQAKATGPHQTLGWWTPNPGGGPDPASAAAQAVRSMSVSQRGGVAVGRADSVSASAASAPTPLPLAAPKDPAPELAARQLKLLEAFSEAFIGLRKGYEQFGAEVGVRTINGSTPLHRARSQRELLDYMLEPRVDPVTTARDLIAIFADFGIHHIAMMEGVTEGVRSMLQTLNPQANDLDPGKRLFSGAKAKGQWKAYLDRFDQMITDDNELHAAIFGNEFARAYASVTLGDEDKGSDEDPS